jgi:hypothetical protein
MYQPRRLKRRFGLKPAVLFLIQSMKLAMSGGDSRVSRRSVLFVVNLPLDAPS